MTIHGKTYNKNRRYGIDTLKAGSINGCVSIVSIQLSLIPSLKTLIRDTLCPEGSISVNGIVYDKNNPSGEQRYVSKAGCDSVLTVNVNFVDLNVSYNRSIFICPGQSSVINLLPNFTPASIRWIPTTRIVLFGLPESTN